MKVIYKAMRNCYSLIHSLSIACIRVITNFKFLPRYFRAKTIQFVFFMAKDIVSRSVSSHYLKLLLDFFLRILLQILNI